MAPRVVDYYNFPSEYWRLVHKAGPPFEHGFFRFGPVSCYGAHKRPSHGVREADETGSNVEASLVYGRLEFPFDPDEILDNLRLERYLSNEPESGRSSLIHNLYYGARRFMPIPVRKYLQRYKLRGRQDIGFPQWPLDSSADELCEAVLATILKASKVKIPFIWFWPEGKRGCILITHDVESRRGLDYCPEIMSIEGSFGFRSSFEIIPERRYRVPVVLLDNIRSEGCEVCLHGLYHDGHLFRDHEEFLRRARLINRYAREWQVSGFRSPVMYRNADWLSALDIVYDMSWPTVGHMDPQRGGCCTVIPYFIGNIVELPLTMIQDYSLFHILGKYDIELWQRQIDGILMRHGLISCIIHPDYVAGQKENRVYRDLLSYLGRIREDFDLWTALPGEIAAWWKDRQAMSLVKKDGRWRIEGKRAELARIAWATLEQDRIHYVVEGPGLGQEGLKPVPTNE